MLREIIEHAQTAAPHRFLYICTWEDYKFYKGKLRSFKLLVRALNSGATRLFRKYCNSTDFGTGNLTKLIAYKQLQDIIHFYKTDINTFEDMLAEYRAYLSSGHFLDSFLGQRRHFQDLYDFRK